MVTFLLQAVGPPCRRTARTVPKQTRIYRPNSTLSQTAKQQLSWPEYLAIRGQKRKWETVSLRNHTLLKAYLKSLYVGRYNTVHNCGLRKWSMVFWFASDGCYEANTWSRTVDLLLWLYSSMHGYVSDVSFLASFGQ
jgi:hypothetical protein